MYVREGDIKGEDENKINAQKVVQNLAWCKSVWHSINTQSSGMGMRNRCVNQYAGE